MARTIGNGRPSYGQTSGPTWQTKLGLGKIGGYFPFGNSNSAPSAVGFAATTNVGTLTARNVANTSLFASVRRLGVVSAGTAGAFSDVYSAAAQIWRGNAPGLGGFDVTINVGQSDAAVVADARGFFGLLASTSALTNVEPNTLTNMVGVGFNAADTNLRVYCNDGSGTATSVDLGSRFPAKTASTDWYQIRIWAEPNDNKVNVEVLRVNTGDRSAVITFDTDLPAAGTFMGLRLFKTNNATAAAVAFDFGDVTVLQDC